MKKNKIFLLLVFALAIFTFANVVNTGNVRVLADSDSDDISETGKEYDGDDADSGEATWELGMGTGGSSCWVKITVHDTVELGSFSWGPGGVEPGGSINSEGFNGDKKVQVNTNCKNTLTTTVYVTSFTLPNGHPASPGSAITDFSVKADEGSLSGGYESFSDLDTSLTVDSYSGPSAKNYEMNYQYEIDENDVSGTYTVTLVYNVST